MLTPVADERTAATRHAAIGAAAVWAAQALGVQLLLEPVSASFIIKQVADGKVYHSFSLSLLTQSDYS